MIVDITMGEFALGFSSNLKAVNVTADAGLQDIGPIGTKIPQTADPTDTKFIQNEIIVRLALTNETP